MWKKAKKCMELLWLEKKIWMMTKRNQCKYHMKWMNFWRNWAKQNVGWRTLKQWRISIRMDEKFKKKSIYTKSQQKPSLLLPFQAEQIVLLFCYCIFFFRNSNSINEVLISFFFEKKMHASVPIMMLLLYLKFRDTLGNNE